MEKLFIAAAVLALGAGLAFSRKERPARAPNGIELPADFADWRLISTSARSDNDTMRAILGNTTAIKAAREGRLKPWPDGTVMAKVAWKRKTNEAWHAAFVPGDFVQVEFMVKDSRKYAETGGWGFARWVGKELKPYGKNPDFVRECFACHLPLKNSDYVFTKPVFIPSVR